MRFGVFLAGIAALFAQPASASVMITEASYSGVVLSGTASIFDVVNPDQGGTFDLTGLTFRTFFSGQTEPSENFVFGFTFDNFPLPFAGYPGVATLYASVQLIQVGSPQSGKILFQGDGSDSQGNASGSIDLEGDLIDGQVGNWHGTANLNILGYNGWTGEYRNVVFQTTRGSATVTGLVPNAGPVPEPATWALMILGFAMAGRVLRKRILPARPLVLDSAPRTIFLEPQRSA